MYNYIKGKIAYLENNLVVLDNGGIGYNIFVAKFMSAVLYPKDSKTLMSSNESEELEAETFTLPSFPFRSKTICFASFSPTFGNFFKYRTFSLSIASKTH